MLPKSLIFVIIAVSITGAVYSSSSYTIFAEIQTSCTGTSKKTQDCQTFDTETEKLDNWKCTLNKDGKTWSCVKARMVDPSSISPELDQAMNAAIEKSENTTKVPKFKDFGKLNDLPTLSPDQ